MSHLQHLDRVAELRTRYRPSGRSPLAEQIDQIDDHCRACIARSPLVVLATADAADRCDASPRSPAC